MAITFLLLIPNRKKAFKICYLSSLFLTSIIFPSKTS
jgi:hypothetical protein